MCGSHVRPSGSHDPVVVSPADALTACDYVKARQASGSVGQNVKLSSR